MRKDGSDKYKIEMCLGSIQEMEEDGLEYYLDKYSRDNRIGYIHFRNVIGKVPNYIEAFVDDGDINMVNIIKIRFTVLFFIKRKLSNTLDIKEIGKFFSHPKILCALLAETTTSPFLSSIRSSRTFIVSPTLIFSERPMLFNSFISNTGSDLSPSTNRKTNF